MDKFIRNIIVITLFIGISYQVKGQSGDSIYFYTKGRTERLSWWKDAKYGMFIHWGLYSKLAGEWKGNHIKGGAEWIMYHAKIPLRTYSELAKTFNPVDFNADTWVKIAKDAGMKYIVITSKHCEGFAMFHSRTNSYNIVDATPFERDPLLELRKSCDKFGLKLGFYYSHNWDWSEPHAKGLANTWDFPETDIKEPQKYYTNKSFPQIKELVTRYNPDIMWFDVPSDITSRQSFEILKIVRRNAPECIINDRISNEHKKKKLIMGDYYTPEQYIPTDLDMNFETCMTLNENWGYCYYDNNWKDAGTIIQNLIMNVSAGGNYLLNVGPDAHGNIPPKAVQILKIAGNWLKQHGEGIYGTEKSPVGMVFYRNAYCTAKPGKLFIHMFDWPHNGELIIGDLDTKVDKVYFLADKKRRNLRYEHINNQDLLIDLGPAKISSEFIDPLANTITIEHTGRLSDKNRDIIIDYAHAASFHPADADTSGNIEYGFNRRWGKNRGNEMKEWNKGGTMTWNFRTIRDGTYKIELVYGAHELSHDNDIHIVINGKEFKHKITEHEGWYNEQAVIVGEVFLIAGTEAILQVKAGYSIIHTIANFKHINFIPVRR